MLAWRRWWSSEGLPGLRMMALERWDPLGIYEQPQRMDEYDGYLNRLGRMLRGGAGPDEVAKYLAKVRQQALKLEENDDADEAFADEVTTWYALEKP